MTRSTVAAGVSLEIDGTAVPIASCRWLSFAPCGCIEGVSNAVSGDDVHLTGEDAFFRDRPKVVREYELRQGLTFKVVTREQYRDTYMGQMMGDCPHTPPWGIELLPTPEGWAWMTTDGFGHRRSYRRHLVPAGSDEYRRGHRPVSLCGKTAGLWFGNARSELRDTIPCTKCMKAATAGTIPAIPAGVVDVPTGDLL